MSNILFINPPSDTKVIRDAHRCGRKSAEGMVWCQTNLAQLASMVYKILTPTVYDCIGMGMNYGELTLKIYEKNPKYVVFQVIPATLSEDMKVAEIAKRTGAKTIAIGAHAVSMPEEILCKYPEVDYVIHGEVEWALKELIEVLESTATPARLYYIRGIAFRDGVKVIKNEDRNFGNLDELDIPFYHHLPMKAYNMPFYGRYVFIIAGRGCPYSCIFCREKLVFKNVVRMKDPQFILDEINTLRAHNVDIYMFHAGDFTADREWVFKLCLKIKRARIKWGCNTHLRTIDKEMAEAMRDAGCVMIAPGIESGSEKVLSKCGKQINRDIIISQVNMLANTGIDVWGYFIIGLPGETVETIDETINLACALPLKIAHFGIATPYYGTEFHEMCVENKWLTATKWEDYDQNQGIAIEYPNLSKEDIRRGLRKAYLRFYGRPRKIAMLLSRTTHMSLSEIIKTARSVLA